MPEYTISCINKMPHCTGVAALDQGISWPRAPEFPQPRICSWSASKMHKKPVWVGAAHRAGLVPCQGQIWAPLACVEDLLPWIYGACKRRFASLKRYLITESRVWDAAELLLRELGLRYIAAKHTVHFCFVQSDANFLEQNLTHCLSWDRLSM